MMVVRLANGFISSVAEGAWMPTGTPAIAKLIERLDGGPEDLRLLFTRGLVPGDDPIISELATRNKRLKGLRTPLTILAEGPRTYSGPGYWLREFLHLSRVWFEVIRFRPDIVYVDRSNVLTGAVLARYGSAPVVLRLMGVPPELRKILTGSQFARRVIRWAYHAPFAHVISTLDGSRTLDFMAAVLEPNVPRSMMLNGVDAASGEDKPPKVLKGIPNAPVVATFLGRVEALKGANFFVDALLALPQDKCLSVHGLIVGQGRLADDLKAKVAAAGAGDRVTFTGPLPHGAMAHVLARSDIYVSLNQQGHLSNATLEAMVHAVPIVIRDIAQLDNGMDEFVRLVPRQAYRVLPHTAEPGDLAVFLADLADAPAERTAMAQALAAFARQNLTSWDNRIRREMTLLHKACGKEGA